MLGDDLLVFDPASGTVVRLADDDAEALRRLTAPAMSIGQSSPDNLAALERLAAAGIVVVDDDGSNFTRRRMLQLSAAGVAAAGLTVVALPRAAAASSPGPGPNPDPPPPPSPSDSVVGAESIQRSGDQISVYWNSSSGNPAGAFTWFVVPGSQSNLNLTNSGPHLSGAFGTADFIQIGTRNVANVVVTFSIQTNTSPPVIIATGVF